MKSKCLTSAHHKANNTNRKPSPVFCVVQVFFSVLMGAMNVGQTAPYIEAIGVARGAAATIFNIIERKSVIDPASTEGEKPNSITGTIGNCLFLFYLFLYFVIFFFFFLFFIVISLLVPCMSPIGFSQLAPSLCNPDKGFKFSVSAIWTSLSIP